MGNIAHLPDRAVLELSGADRVTFLQGMVSNDVAAVAPGRAVWAALLTPQGKWTADFFILTDGERLLLDCERAQLPGISQRLSRFKLRAAVAFADLSESVAVMAAWGDDTVYSAPGIIAQAPDPRLPEAGLRVLTTSLLPTTATREAWDRHRIALGLPDGSRDLEPEKTVLLEAGFDELSGVSWTKGCYLGQELTARTKYRGLVKRRLFPVTLHGATPPPGTPITLDSREVGTLRSTQGEQAMALLRLDALTGAPLACADAQVTHVKPGWMMLT
jgi:folate-binding protein YgfZ